MQLYYLHAWNLGAATTWIEIIRKVHETLTTIKVNHKIILKISFNHMQKWLERDLLRIAGLNFINF